MMVLPDSMGITRRGLAHSLLLWAVMVGVLIVLGRLVFVALYAESVPYWDQWDAEGAYLFKPWLEGDWSVADLFAAHNEHRIAFTRMISLLVFEANQEQWDNRVLAFVNVAVYGGVSALLFFVLVWRQAQPIDRVLLALAVVVMGWLPYGHTNSLVGFQNQFYLMSGFAIAIVAVAAEGRDNWFTYGSVAGLSVLSLFTMASGLLAAVAGGVVLAYRSWRGELRPRPVITTIVALALIALGGYLLTPHIAGHDPLKAPDAAAWVRAFFLHLGWPLKPGPTGALILWLPSVIAVWCCIRSPERKPGELVALGLAGWVVLQCAAIAYSRGSDGNTVGERYVDILALGLLANVWLALGRAIPESPWSSWRKVSGRLSALSLYGAVVLLSLARHVPGDMAKVQSKYAISLIQTENVRRFVQYGDTAQLDQPFMHIPYPDPKRLASLLSDPTLRGILPASVRAPLALAPDTIPSGFANGGQEQGFAITSCTWMECATATGEWRSDMLRSGYRWLHIPVLIGGDAERLSLLLESDSASSSVEYAGLVEVPDMPFQLVVRDQTKEGWISFDAPREVAGLSAWALRMNTVLRRWFGIAWDVQRLRQSVVLQPSDTHNGKALHIGDSASVGGRFIAPRRGYLDGFSIFMGNYGRVSDGVLHARLCVRAGCADGRADLARSIDNMYFNVPLPEGLRLQIGETVRFSLQAEGVKHPVVLWTYPPDEGQAPRLDTQTSSEYTGRTVRVRIGFRD